MVYVLILLAELILLSLISRRLVNGIFTVCFLLTRSKTISIWILTIILFPGTVVHELAHLFTAEILGVRTGKLTLTPEGLDDRKIGKEAIQAGGVMIAETDPLRRTLIGLAPVYMGIATLAALSYFLSISHNLYSSFFILYSLFAVSTSMFSSAEDMKGVVPFTATVGIFLAAGYAAGLRIGITGELASRAEVLLVLLVWKLALVILVNLAVLTAGSILLLLFRRKN